MCVGVDKMEGEHYIIIYACGNSIYDNIAQLDKARSRMPLNECRKENRDRAN